MFCITLRLFFFAALFLGSGSYAAIGPKADLHIVNRRVSPDGFARSAVLAGSSANNVTFPGPVISGMKGDKFELNVINSLTDKSMPRGTSIHWHGFFQQGSSWADGPVGVTQCPISPANSFLYNFRVPDQAGTFWYHSHYLTQYCDGLRGVFVVYDPDDPNQSMYDVDDESTIITLADWYHAPSLSIGRRPIANATLINGLGRAAGGAVSPLAVVNVVQGKRYRFRLVSLACDPNYVFSIDHHSMTIIEVDGIDHKPVTVDSIQIFTAQRYSFVLEANRPIDNYWIRANPNVESDVPRDFRGGINSAIFRYKGAPRVDPHTRSSLSQPLLEADLRPQRHAGAPGGSSPADIAINLEIGLDPSTGTFTINGQHFVTPNIPVLLQILSRTRTPQELLPAGSMYSLPRDKIVELSIPGGSVGFPHPFHLHGHAFDVIRSAGSSVYNYKNPPRRDVVSTGGPGDNVTIRFKTDNPGPWIFHCHIDWHLEKGLAIVFAESTDRVANETHPDAWDQLCPIFDSQEDLQ